MASTLLELAFTELRAVAFWPRSGRALAWHSLGKKPTLSYRLAFSLRSAVCLATRSQSTIPYRNATD
eukprot:9549320-Lingulodinium_polyedra.AAC.1